MKKMMSNGLLLLLTIILFSACGSTKSASEKAQLANEIENAVQMSDFTFEATYAHPTGFRSIYLSPYYDVKVSPDTVTAHLPYLWQSLFRTHEPG